jgi:DnaJ-domain-containing protein 1
MPGVAAVGSTICTGVSLSIRLTAIAKHIEAMRGQHRWGVGSLEQAFRGYEALLSPPKEERTGEGWWSVLQIPSTATLQEAEAAYRKLASYYHPDKKSGNEQMMAIINQAITEARKELTAGRGNT